MPERDDTPSYPGQTVYPPLSLFDRLKAEAKYEIFGSPEKSFFGLPPGGLNEWLGYDRPEWMLPTPGYTPLEEEKGVSAVELAIPTAPHYMKGWWGGKWLWPGDIATDIRKAGLPTRPLPPPPVGAKPFPLSRPSFEGMAKAYENARIAGDEVAARNIAANAFRSGNFIPIRPEHYPWRAAGENYRNIGEMLQGRRPFPSTRPQIFPMPSSPEYGFPGPTRDYRGPWKYRPLQKMGQSAETILPDIGAGGAPYLYVDPRAGQPAAPASTPYPSPGPGEADEDDLASMRAYIDSLPPEGSYEDIRNHFEGEQRMAMEAMKADLEQERADNYSALMSFNGIVEAPTLDLDTGGDFGSMSVEIDGKTYLIPTQDDWTTQQAIDRFKKTGEHWGAFSNLEDAQDFERYMLPTPQPTPAETPEPTPDPNAIYPETVPNEPLEPQAQIGNFMPVPARTPYAAPSEYNPDYIPVQRNPGQNRWFDPMTGYVGAILA